jgi:hypothetical protein
MRKMPLQLTGVMAGLDQDLIRHLALTGASGPGNSVDARVKPAHDHF